MSAPYFFNNHRTFLEDELVVNYKKEGLFEKKEIKLFSKKDSRIFGRCEGY